MHERATVGAAVSAAVVARLLVKMARARIAAANKLSHRLSTLRVADFSASSNVKGLDATRFSSYYFLHSPKTPRC